MLIVVQKIWQYQTFCLCFTFSKLEYKFFVCEIIKRMQNINKHNSLKKSFQCVSN